MFSFLITGYEQLIFLRHFAISYKYDLHEINVRVKKYCLLKMSKGASDLIFSAHNGPTKDYPRVSVSNSDDHVFPTFQATLFLNGSKVQPEIDKLQNDFQNPAINTYNCYVMFYAVTKKENIRRVTTNLELNVCPTSPGVTHKVVWLLKPPDSSLSILIVEMNFSGPVQADDNLFYGEISVNLIDLSGSEEEILHIGHTMSRSETDNRRQ